MSAVARTGSKADRLRSRLSINPDEPVAALAPPRPAPAPAVEPAAPVAEPPAGEGPAVGEAPAPAEPPATTEPAAPRRTRRARAGAPAAVNAVEDPGITAGRKDYRSFYVEDATFARFRAAIYWLSRREDATDEVPENMSVAVEAWMAETAGTLERRFNDGEVFRMPPPSKRRRPAR